MDLVTELIALRRTRRIAQQAVATACGVDQSTVSLWERRKVGVGGSARILLERFIADEKAKPLPEGEAA